MYIRENRAAIKAELEDIFRGEWLREMNKRDHKNDLAKLYHRLFNAGVVLWYDGDSLAESKKIWVECARYSALTGERWVEEFYDLETVVGLADGLWLSVNYKSVCSGLDGYGSQLVIFSK